MARAGRRGRGNVTIEDVARMAGVSAMTVSRVINAEGNVRDTTKAAVEEAIRRLNYSPNSAARSLAAGQSVHIGLLYANPSAAYLSQFLIGALEGTRRASCHLVIEVCESEGADEQAEATRRFLTTEVEGVVLPPPLSESQPILAELAAAGIPAVTVAMGWPREDALNVRIDDFAAARDMTEHLIGLGHRRIGMIKGHPAHMASAERLRGFRAALAAHGLDAEAAPVEQGYFTFRSGLVAAERLLALPNRPTAIFAGNDDMAAAAIGVAHRHGLVVPDDLSVAGFDDTAPATTVWPELTTVRQPISAMAEAAVELLLARLRTMRAGMRSQAAERVLAHDLVIRESVAAPRRAARPRSAASALYAPRAKA